MPNIQAYQENAHLTDLGRSQARRLGQQLAKIYGIDHEQPVAVSELLRNQETAAEAGFINTNSYSELDEMKRGPGWTDLRWLIESRRLPIVAINRVEAILEKPPIESVWITHGFVIANLCAVLGVHQEKRLIPNFCEIRELQI
ncbi:MAG TPA: histidine phosphatase family protein [Candidatus Saccharimonadales bacterium]|nr:histidine phosphatase family protein [Candidatus Saccharimonadales bacterium]